MGILSSTATFARFYVPDPITEDFWTYVDEKLKAGCFKDTDEGQEKSVGFSSWDDFFDASFTYGSYHKGEYVAFQFRLDQRSVPPIIKKQYVRQAVQKYRDEHEGKWPSRQEKREIQEDISNWLLNRALPKPSACEIVWNPASKWMYLGTTSPKMMEAFMEHFEAYFRLYPVPLYHVNWAVNLIPLNVIQKDFLNGMVTVQSQNAMEEGRFLGYEFLTWLWFQIEYTGGTFSVSEHRQAEIQLGERMVLILPGEGKERVICTTQANALYEARTALKQGKLVEQLQVFLRTGDNEYVFTLDSSLWALKGLKTPKQLPDYEEDDADGKFLEKMYFLEEVASMLNSLYGKFLSERLNAGWESDMLPLIKQWIGGNIDEGATTVRNAEVQLEAPPF